MPVNYHGNTPSQAETWPDPNLVNPDHRGWMPIYAGVLVGISTSLLFARLYVVAARKWSTPFGWDDAQLASAWAAAVGLATIAIIGSTRYELDRHIWDIDPSKLNDAARAGWIGQVFAHCGMCLVRAGSLCFCHRKVRRLVDSRLHACVWLASALDAAFFIAILVCYCLICTPLDAHWTFSTPKSSTTYKCLNTVGISLAAGIGDNVMNVAAIFLATLMLREHLHHMAARPRLLLSLLLLLSSLAIVASGALRTYFLFDLTRTTDLSWSIFNLLLASLAELHASIIFVCAFHFRTYLRLVFRPSPRTTLSSFSAGPDDFFHPFHLSLTRKSSSPPISITQKSQIVLPKPACTSCGVRRCSTCGIVQHADGTITVMPKSAAETDRRRHCPLPPTPAAGHRANRRQTVITTCELPSGAQHSLPRVEEERHGTSKPEFGSVLSNAQVRNGPYTSRAGEVRIGEKGVAERILEKKRLEDQTRQARAATELKLEGKILESKTAEDGWFESLERLSIAAFDNIIRQANSSHGSRPRK